MKHQESFSTIGEGAKKIISEKEIPEWAKKILQPGQATLSYHDREHLFNPDGYRLFYVDKEGNIKQQVIRPDLIKDFKERKEHGERKWLVKKLTEIGFDLSKSDDVDEMLYRMLEGRRNREGKK